MLIYEELTSDSVVSCSYREVLYILLVVDITTKPESIMYLRVCRVSRARCHASGSACSGQNNMRAAHKSSSEKSSPGYEEKDMRCAASPRSARAEVVVLVNPQHLGEAVPGAVADEQLGQVCCANHTLSLKRGLCRPGPRAHYMPEALL